jgi:hypothetical protein
MPGFGKVELLMEVGGIEKPSLKMFSLFASHISEPKGHSDSEEII